MHIFNRLILLIITLLFMFASLVVAIYCFGFTGIGSLPYFFQTLYGEWGYGLLFVLGFIAGAWVLYPFFTVEEEDSTVINRTDLGEVDITLEALKNLVQGVARQQEGIEEINTKLTATETGITISLRGKVHPSTIIPEMTSDLQKIIKNYIQDTTGVNVEEIKVLIENIYETEETEMKVE